MAEPVPTRSLRMKFSTRDPESGDPEETIEINSMLPELETSFDVLQRVTSDANSARLRIVNLGPASRGWLQRTVKRSLDTTNKLTARTGSAASSSRQAKIETQRRADVHTDIDAGYDDRVGRLFEGSCQFARSQQSRTEWITDLHVGDGMALQLGAVVAREFAPNTLVFTVVKHLVESMGLALGNLTQANLRAAMGHPQNRFIAGYSAIGSAKWSLDWIIRLTGAEWFIDEGTFYVTRKTLPLDEPETLLNQENGLVGRPQGIEGGGVVARTLVRNDIRIARQVRLESEEISGVFRADAIRHRGNNRRGTFETSITLQTIEPVGRFA